MLALSKPKAEDEEDVKQEEGSSKGFACALCDHVSHTKYLLGIHIRERHQVRTRTRRMYTLNRQYAFIFVFIESTFGSYQQA